ncbi:unnamed protein product [Clonostachys rosea]|uniref:Uncharacterized protein n=1 Tax=Bionectria ochroleuca TaxID=29856 RepID=A0ABY6UU90_BIOOC|nr:unnamed protein product [Clonostachys rosea]
MATPPTPTTKARRDRDTGFPEPFCGNYNTTLPHPDADTSPNAVISGDHLSLEGSMRRRRLSMLHKHRRTVSQSSGNSNSSINTPSQALHSVLGAIQSQIPGTSPAARPGSSAQDSIDEEEHHDQDDMRPESRDTMPPSPNSRRGLFHGWRKGRH